MATKNFVANVITSKLNDLRYRTLVGYIRDRISESKSLEIYRILNRDAFPSVGSVIDFLLNIEISHGSSIESECPWYILLKTRKTDFPVLIEHKDTTYVILDENEDCEVEFDACRYVLDRMKHSHYRNPKCRGPKYCECLVTKRS